MSALGYDVATALWQGARPYQEDTLLADFHGGVDRGFAILADGMGGHAAGDLASRLVVIDAASHLKFLMHSAEALEKTLAAELTSAIETANDVLKDRAEGDSRLHGMGSTFLATVIFEDRLYWASVGDSPLYLWREGKLRQLNEDHSMAPVIDQMAKTGEITAEEAANHPDRNALTSVLMGRPLKAMDVPKTATVLDPGDVLIQASDGVQFLEEAQISRVVARGGSSRDIADALMAALRDLEDPTQDNTSVMVLQLTQDGTVRRGVTDAGVTNAAAERAAGAAPVVQSAPRAPTPTPAARPAGARRWVVPAAILSSAALLAGVMFGLPALQSGEDLAAASPELAPDSTPLITPEPAPVIALAEATVADAPAPLPTPLPAAQTPLVIGQAPQQTLPGAASSISFGAAAPTTAAPAVAAEVPLAPIPDTAVPSAAAPAAPTAQGASTTALAQVNPANVHEIIGETAEVVAAPAANLTRSLEVGLPDKFSQPAPDVTATGSVGLGAFTSGEASGVSSGLGVGQIGQVPDITPQSEALDAPETAPAQPLILAPEAERTPMPKSNPRAVP